jgi:hypothetical protein
VRHSKQRRCALHWANHLHGVNPIAIRTLLLQSYIVTAFSTHRYYSYPQPILRATKATLFAGLGFPPAGDATGIRGNGLEEVQVRQVLLQGRQG